MSSLTGLLMGWPDSVTCPENRARRAPARLAAAAIPSCSAAAAAVARTAHSALAALTAEEHSICTAPAAVAREAGDGVEI